MGGNEMKQYIFMKRIKLRMKESSQFGGYDSFGN